MLVWMGRHRLVTCDFFHLRSDYLDDVILLFRNQMRVPQTHLQNCLANFQREQSGFSRPLALGIFLGYAVWGVRPRILCDV